MSMSETKIPDTRETLKGFFDSIAPRYDGINRLLSWNLDDVWRRWARDRVLQGHEKSILDLGTGTGKFLKTFFEKQKFERAVGIDFSLGMLSRAAQELSGKADFLSADFHDLPFQDASFDLVISSYTLRSVQEFPAFFREIRRILVPGGRAALLCLTRPAHPFWRALAYPYLKFYLPLVGGAVSGNRSAYEFLSSSILTFQEPAHTTAMLKEEGFRDASIHPMTLGLATLILATR